MSSAADFLPATERSRPALGTLRRAATGCRGCDLHRDATQTVFGAGRAGARLMLVGEQPGDQEDRAGEPFVGPAGRLLDRALEEAGIDRSTTYVTNAVKHFKFSEGRGKRRIHQKPNRTEVVSCRPWLLAEIDAVRPQTLVCLGATAAQSLWGGDFRLTAHRGHPVDPPEPIEPVSSWPVLFATVHPSAVLRGPDDRRAAMFDGLVDDLRGAGRFS